MAQHDYNIANQTFPNTRTDINNALSAIASNNSGTAAPSTTFANQWFYETDTNLLQIRNEDNDAYITIAELDQTNDTVEYFKSDSIRTALIEFTDGDDAITIGDGGTVGFSALLTANANITMAGTTPTLTIGDGGAEDTKIVFDGNAQDFYIGLDDSADDLVIGVGSTLGTTAAVNITEDAHVVVGGSNLSNFGIPTAPQFVSGTSNTTAEANDLSVVGSGVATNNVGIINDNNSGLISAIGLETRTSGAGRNAILNVWQTSFNADLVFRLRTGSGSSGEIFRINSGEQCISTGGETSPDANAGGLTLNQADLDSYIMTLKSSDVSHGMTSVAEADTYGAIQKANSSNGGLSIFGLCDAGTTGVEVQSYFESVNTSKASNANVPIKMITRARNGTSSTAPSNVSANSNLFGVASGTSLRFIVDSDGDLHVDGSTSITAFDNYEDAQLVRAYDLSHGKGVINSKFDKFISYNHEKLAEMKLVGREEDGTPNHFINMTGMQRLHNGAIWQQYEKHQKLANAMYELAKAAVGEDKANEILEQNEIQLLN